MQRDDGKKYTGEKFFEPADIRFGGDLPSPEFNLDETAEDDGLYADRILERVRDILREPRHYVSRTLKAGAFRRRPVNILGMPALPRSSAFLATPDGLAHYLSAGAEIFAPALNVGVENIILIPEAVYTERFLLTHILAPAERTLLVYLHPTRLNRARRLDLPERLGTGHRPGLLRDLIESLPEHFPREGRTSPTDNPLHKFVLPLKELEANEIALMDDVQRRYARKFQLDHELI